VTFNGDDLACSGILSGLTVTEVITALDAYICEAIDDINTAINLINVGTGLQIYAGIDALGRRKIRTLTSSDDSVILEYSEDLNEIDIRVATTDFCITSEDDSILITQDEETGCLDLSVKTSTPFCLTSKDKTVIITEEENCLDLSVVHPDIVNVGAGEGIYKELNILTNQHELKSITSNDSSINVVSSTDELDISINNLQKTVDTFPYTLLSTDDKYTIFVDNGAANVVINVPNGLVSNFSIVFIQKGTGGVTIQQSGTATLLYPSTLQNKIKGQYFWAMVEKEIATDTYYLLGSLKTV
jgi:hypothetical protein